MYYIKQTTKDIDFKNTLIVILFLELDKEGKSLREIAFDDHNNVAHKFPSNNFENGTYGLLDLTYYAVDDLKSDLSENEFEKI